MSFIIERRQTPNGMDIQLENWHDKYEFMAENATIGFYPMCQNSIHGEVWDYPKRGEIFRAALNFSSELEAREALDLLESGEKTFMHYIDNYETNVISKDDFIKGFYSQ